MDKTKLKGYVEFLAHLEKYQIHAEFADLARIADETQIQTFGWPIGLVLHVEKYQPQVYSQSGIRALIDDRETFDYWTLQKNGDYYILMSLFEDLRKENSIFLDTRTIRTTELLLRTARLYKALGVPENEVLACRIEHGGMQGRILTAANPMRAFSFSYQRKCAIPTIVNSFSEPIANYLDTVRLKEMVFEVVKSITEVCEMFIPSKSQVTDPMVDAFLSNKVI